MVIKNTCLVIFHIEFLHRHFLNYYTSENVCGEGSCCLPQFLSCNLEYNKVIYTIQVIEENAFSGLVHLSGLHLNNNIIHTIDKGALKHLKGSAFTVNI